MHFDKIDHVSLLHKLKGLGIIGNLGMWAYNNRSHFVRLPGRISVDSPVLSGLPQGTVFGALLFMMMMIADINKYVYESNAMSFAVDTRIYAKINNVSDCTSIIRDT